MDEKEKKKPYSDIRWYEPIGMGTEVLCNICKLYLRNTFGPIACERYPNGIPSSHLDLVENDPKPNCFVPIKP